MSGWMCFALMLPGEPFSPPMCLARRSRLAGPRNLAGCCVCTPAQNRFLGPLWRQQATGPTFSKGDVSLLCCLRLSKHHAREVKFVFFFFSPRRFLWRPDVSTSMVAVTRSEQQRWFRPQRSQRRLLANTKTHTCIRNIAELLLGAPVSPDKS